MPKTGGYHRVMKVLELVGNEPQGLSVTQIAQALEMSKGAASRLLAALVEAGFIERDASRRHYVSIRLWSLGVRSLQHLRIGDMARPLIYEAARSSGISIYLAVVRDECVYLLEQVTAPHGVAMSVPLASVVPHYVSAPGKAILAHAASPETDAIFSRPLVAFTEHTITTREHWDREMSEIREQGYALSSGEYDTDTFGIAVPVFDRSGTAVASLGNATPRSEFNGKYVERTAGILQAVASTLSSALGFTPRAF